MLKVEFFSSARARLETALLAGSPHRGMDCRQRLRMSIAGSSSGDAGKIARSKVDLHELSPVGRRAMGGRDGRRFERFAEVREDLPDRPRLGCKPEWKLLPHPGHEFGLLRREVS